MLWLGKPVPSWRVPSGRISIVDGRGHRTSPMAFLRTVRTTSRIKRPLWIRDTGGCGSTSAPGWWTQPSSRPVSAPTAALHTPVLTHMPSKNAAHLLKLSPALGLPYPPSLPSFGGHLQTLLGAMARKVRLGTQCCCAVWVIVCWHCLLTLPVQSRDAVYQLPIPCLSPHGPSLLPHGATCTLPHQPGQFTGGAWSLSHLDRHECSESAGPPPDTPQH